MRIETPWGPSQTSKEIAPGIIRYSTASHGGYWLSAERVAAMPADCRAVEPWAGRPWYEEDQDWAIVCLAFPEAFQPWDYKFAVDTCGYGDYLTQLVTPERKAKAQAWTDANTDKFARGSEGTGPDRTWFVNAYNLADPTKRITKVYPGIPLLPPVFTQEQFEAAEIYKG